MNLSAAIHAVNFFKAKKMSLTNTLTRRLISQIPLNYIAFYLSCALYYTRSYFEGYPKAKKYCYDMAWERYDSNDLSAATFATSYAPLRLLCFESLNGVVWSAKSNFIAHVVAGCYA